MSDESDAYVPRWCACLGTPEPPPTWHFLPGHNSSGPTPTCGFGDEDDDSDWFDMNTSDAYEGSDAPSGNGDSGPAS